ncbi:MAG: peptidoglycan DD-metalloendopeptidase family protein [Bacteroidaceae bacterium]|nr:peptidoglycan DD-metalloendopeptidase family protein [Bacteroidaceae bacterium]
MRRSIITTFRYFYKILLATSVIAILADCKGKTNTVAEDVIILPDSIISTKKWRIDVDRYEVVDGIIGNGQILSKLLEQYGVGASIARELEIASADVYSVRKLRSGNNYHILREKDSTAVAEWFVYEISPITNAVYSLHDSIYCYIDTIPTDTVQRHISGVIESSLWNSMVDGGASYDLTILIADMYSWTIDFFGIQKGDSFSVYYQDVMANDTLRVGTDRILASNFITGGANHYSFYYVYRDGRGEYFDEQGNSLRRAFLKAPLSYTRISSTFSNARRHPVTKIVRPHHGVDYAAPSGTPVYSVGDGVVTVKGWDSKGGGNYLKIKHNATYTTEYMHLRGFASGISQGTHVRQGQLIGYVGSTGMSTGPHLDYRVFKDGTAINPLSMDLPAVDPIAEEDMPAYLRDIAPYLNLIGVTVSDSLHADTLAQRTIDNNVG